MNAGLANLATLRAFLLPVALQAGTDDDVALLEIGLGVAGAMERYCGRRFPRAVAVADIFGADRCQFVLARFPVEAVTKIERKLNEAEGYLEQSLVDAVQSIDLGNGIVYFPDNADAGPYYAQMRFTYTGGYFFNVKEPADNGYPTAQPSGSTALPDDLRLAWLLQCGEVWNKMDKLGTSIAEKPDASNLTSALTLAPLVKQTLDGYRRLNFA